MSEGWKNPKDLGAKIDHEGGVEAFFIDYMGENYDLLKGKLKHLKPFIMEYRVAHQRLWEELDKLGVFNWEE